MKALRTFFGQVLRKNDVDLITQGTRESLTRLSIDLTGKQGGVINGLNVYLSVDSLSVLISPGIFYSTGDFNATNNLGGGERAAIYTTQSFTGLPSTAPIANQPSYLVVYVKIANQNSNPDPTQLQTTTTSKNIQTGENVLTRDYPVGAIVISNPVLLNQVNSFNGVPIALLQVDYNGISQVSSNGTVQSINTSIKRNYVVGGAIDVASQVVLPAAIPNNFITTRMIGSGQIIGSQFLTGSINSAAIAPYDGSANVTNAGNGIATGHLKTGAVTLNTISYQSGLNNFSQRNYVSNASFEQGSAALSWNFTGATGTTATVVQSSNTAMFGNNALLLTGGASGSPAVSKILSISQNVVFPGPINKQNLTAYAYINPQNNFNGTDNINGVLTFYNNITDATNQANAISTQIFASYSGISTNNYIQIQTAAPIIVTGNVSVVNIAISGQFNNTVYVDGVYLGLTSITPKFDVSINEQVGAGLNASNINQGTLGGQFIANGAITPNLIPLAVGGLYNQNSGGIVGSQIATGTITASNIASGTITNAQLAPGISALPHGAIVMFLTVPNPGSINDPILQGCPVGMARVTALDGFSPLGMNPKSTLGTLNNPGNSFGVPIGGTTGAGNNITTVTSSTHAHNVSNKGIGFANGGDVENVFTNGGGSQATDGQVVTVQNPFVTVMWCQQQ